MPIQATVILDSGCFLSHPKEGPAEIGYFESSHSVSDIRVIVDGKEEQQPQQMNLGNSQCTIEVRHVNADGSIKKDGVKAPPTFQKEVLQLPELYGQNMPVDRKQFDCIIHFDSGHFCSALLKPRQFKEHQRQPGNTFAHTPGAGVKSTAKPIAHNIFVHYKLNDGEALELARDGTVFWSSKNSTAKERLEIEIIADNTTADKFYRMALQDTTRASYWLPNEGDPPPVCPDPPCFP